jgi:hypothetical protein
MLHGKGEAHGGGRWYVRENDLEQMVERAVNSTGHLRRVQEAA